MVEACVARCAADSGRSFRCFPTRLVRSSLKRVAVTLCRIVPAQSSASWSLRSAPQPGLVHQLSPLCRLDSIFSLICLMLSLISAQYLLILSPRLLIPSIKM